MRNFRSGFNVLPVAQLKSRNNYREPPSGYGDCNFNSARVGNSTKKVDDLREDGIRRIISASEANSSQKRIKLEHRVSEGFLVETQQPVADQSKNKGLPDRDVLTFVQNVTFCESLKDRIT